MKLNVRLALLYTYQNVPIKDFLDIKLMVPDGK